MLQFRSGGQIPVILRLRLPGSQGKKLWRFALTATTTPEPALGPESSTGQGIGGWGDSEGRFPDRTWGYDDWVTTTASEENRKYVTSPPLTDPIREYTPVPLGPTANRHTLVPIDRPSRHRLARLSPFIFPGTPGSRSTHNHSSTGPAPPKKKTTQRRTVFFLCPDVKARLRAGFLIPPHPAEPAAAGTH